MSDKKIMLGISVDCSGVNSETGTVCFEINGLAEPESDEAMRTWSPPTC